MRNNILTPNFWRAKVTSPLKPEYKNFEVQIAKIKVQEYSVIIPALSIEHAEQLGDEMVKNQGDKMNFGEPADYICVDHVSEVSND